MFCPPPFSCPLFSNVVFRDTDAFNIDISKWKILYTADVTNMFYNAEAFNQTWCAEPWEQSRINKDDFYGTDNALAFCCLPGLFHNTSQDTQGSESLLCATCPEGQYTNQAGVFKSCKNCPRGWYQGETGTQYCLPCLTGAFQNATGGSSCKICPIGFSNGDTVNEESCTSCKAGRFQNDSEQANCKGTLHFDFKN